MAVSTLRGDFFKQYVFPNKPERDFEQAGILAQFASGHPKDWPQAYHVIDYSLNIPLEKEVPLKTSHTDVSSDGKLLAISTSADRILIYDIVSRDLRVVLEGAGIVRFRPWKAADNRNAASQSTGDNAMRPGYTLVCSVACGEERYKRKLPQLMFWELDHHGRLLDQEEAIDSAALAKQAIDAIIPALTTNHEWTKDFIDASNLHKEFTKALSEAAINHRRRHNNVIKDALIGGYESVPFTSDGRLLLYHANNESTQRGKRKPEELPLLVIYDVDAGVELHRLMGHTNIISWSAISPDNTYAASVSWDGSLRMYSVSTGELVWATEKNNMQSWAGAFSPDSKFIIWSTQGGRVVQVHDAANGRQMSTMQERFSDWCRCLKWHPTRSQIALCVERNVYVWDPFDGPDGKILQHLKLDDNKTWRYLAGIQAVGWMKEGNLLYVESVQGTKLVYDVHSNTKELFNRPLGVEGGCVEGGFYGVFQDDMEQEFYLSIDGDGKVRYFRTSVAASLSWWEKTPVIAAKKPYPETGKYVKIVRLPRKETKQEDIGREKQTED
ncbi:WD40 repeat [Pyrenophora tritici-repentis]|uniref:G-beta repeat n=1 Tax=Pyrenophora tritici-repentis TaxID=45151 RepID=A0A2W1EZN0_9PLEO|nr:WD40 repeat protein [Pyrenophora tritici-repentis]KAF7447814.1 WD40 repeat protein [Pyrenophora tritici-repentis]KAF7571517.1 WD40 repeat protein [Pyrenophora tritici-repentis]KAG9385259.1 WD40 repeat protein [Pyrenophora tritici-repentis]KAI0579261.1 WD40 repeat protein [Pyrenophora tritici-repentis]